MPTQEYALDEQVKVWVEVALPELQGLPNEVSFRKDLSEGANGSPQAYLQTLPAGYKVRPHFHTEAQFQVVLEGSISFPAHDLGAIAVHYSDRHTAYGPFVAGPDFKFAVVRPRKAGKDFMEDRQARQRRDPLWSRAVRLFSGPTLGAGARVGAGYRGQSTFRHGW